jgi:hypothetical protein
LSLKIAGKLKALWTRSGMPAAVVPSRATTVSAPPTALYSVTFSVVATPVRLDSKMELFETLMCCAFSSSENVPRMPPVTPGAGSPSRAISVLSTIT